MARTGLWPVLATLLISCAGPRGVGLAPKDPSPSQPRIYVGEGLKNSRLIHYEKPVYPRETRRAHATGVVRLNILVLKNGTIGSIETVSGHPLLVPAAVQAVKSWRYEPVRLRGEPVEVKTIVELNFPLR